MHSRSAANGQQTFLMLGPEDGYVIQLFVFYQIYRLIGLPNKIIM
jgi:hypothetical protein